MDFYTSFSNQKILIPTLQRDYVQGASEDVIVPFLDCLLSNENVDLNYIYGYNEDGAFVPIDGQQRLITLWLLHLYVWSSLKSEPFTTQLSFQTREFANGFCQRLCKNIHSIILSLKKESSQAEETEKGAQSLDEAIADSNWFISSWKKNSTINNMLHALRFIHRKVCNSDINEIYSRLFTSPSAISFAFLNMTEENGLDDDIYIKMNGRGRPLSAFENLKSWIDNKIEPLSFSEKWKAYMDNRWANFFWKNRNKGQEHPEEIDDEQLHLFCNLLYLFHVKYPYLLKSRIDNTELREEFIDYLKITDPNASNDDIIKKFFTELAAGHMPSLIWIERLNLMPKRFLQFAFSSLNRLSARSEDINNSELYFGDTEISTTPIYNLSMKDATITRSLPLLYAALRYRDGSITEFYDWMRILRNLILNSDEEANLIEIMRIIEMLSIKAKREDIFHALHFSTFSNTQLGNIKSVFTPRQVDEEILKAAPEYKAFRPLFADMENMRFFSGRIKVLFHLVDGVEFTAENIENTIFLLKNIFNGGNYGISQAFDDGNYYFRRTLTTYGWYGIKRNRCWSFCNGLDEWRAYVRDVDKKPESLISFCKEFAPKKYDKAQLIDAIKNKVEKVSSQDFRDILKTQEPMTRFYFINYPGVWDFMKTKRAKWNNPDFNVVLNSKNSNNTNQIELRTLALYCDYLHIMETNKKFSPWGIYIWTERGASCFYFQKKTLFSNGNEYTVELDVSFKGIDGRRDSENCYGLTLFLPQCTDNPDEAIRNYELLQSSYGNLIEKLGLTSVSENYRFSNNRNLSRDEVIERINLLLTEIL